MEYTYQHWIGTHQLVHHHFPLQAQIQFLANSELVPLHPHSESLFHFHLKCSKDSEKLSHFNHTGCIAAPIAYFET